MAATGGVPPEGGDRAERARRHSVQPGLVRRRWRHQGSDDSRTERPMFSLLARRQHAGRVGHGPGEQVLGLIDLARLQLRNVTEYGLDGITTIKSWSVSFALRVHAMKILNEDG